MNYYLDSVIEGSLSGYIQFWNLEVVELPSFNLIVKSNSITNLHLRLTFHSGSIKGLSGELHRRGDCSNPSWEANNVTTRCPISLNGVRVSYDGVATGHDWFDTKEQLRIDMVVENTHFLVDITQEAGKCFQRRSNYRDFLAVSVKDVLLKT